MTPLALLALVLLLPGAAQAGCVAEYPRSPPLERPTRQWGTDRLRPLPEGEIEVRYPAGGWGAKGSGAGFLARLPAPVGAACLAYRVRFPDGFAFARGGKLPGLFGGSAPAGCRPATDGFSARLMWREHGAGELYLYHPGMPGPCGSRLGRWRFTPGRWTTIEQEVVLAEGRVRVWIDGRMALDWAGLDLGPRIDGVIFSSFFGGNDASWASPVDQAARFGGMRVGVK